MTPLARTLAGLAALSALTGLVIDLTLNTQAQLAHGGTFFAALWDMARYFTNWSSTAMVVIMGAAALAPSSAPARPAVRLVMTAAIALVAVVYYTLLASNLAPFGTLAFVADNLLHAVGPAFCVLSFVTAKDAPLPASAALWAIVPPAVYGAYGLTRGLLTGSYPYWFLDLPTLGIPAFTRNTLLLFAGFALLALFFIMLMRAAMRFRDAA